MLCIAAWTLATRSLWAVQRWQAAALQSPSAQAPKMCCSHLASAHLGAARVLLQPAAPPFRPVNCAPQLQLRQAFPDWPAVLGWTGFCPILVALALQDLLQGWPAAGECSCSRRRRRRRPPARRCCRGRPPASPQRLRPFLSAEQAVAV